VIAYIRTLLIVLLCGLLAFGSCAQSKSESLSASEQLELRTLVGQLTDRDRSAKTKQEAAELLLTRPYPQAIEALKELLSDPSNRVARIAIAEAIASQGAEERQFVEPLMSMLQGADETVRAPAGRALASYKDAGVMEALVAIAHNARTDKAVRLVTISSMQRVLDKRAVDALVRLLKDPEADIRAAAAESLSKLTNIRTFGNDPDQWIAWWEKNKNKARSAWLADLADSLGRSKVGLEVENAHLRERLATAMRRLYTATPGAQRAELLLSLLRDPLADVRLVGLGIVNDTVAANQPVPDPASKQVQALLADPDPRVRRDAALLVVNLGNGDVAAALLERLDTENTPFVRVAVLTSLGQVREAKVLDALIREIGSPEADVAAAASASLGRVAARQPLSDSQRPRAIEALRARYRQASDGGNHAALREGLLAAMAGVGAVPECQAAFRAALGDSSAAVRLAGVNGLATGKRPEAAGWIAPLVKDPDRGVRQAAISALAVLDGAEYLSVVLERTQAAVEPDATVRQQAWTVALTELKRSKAATIETVLKSMRDRPAADAQRLPLLELWVAALEKEGAEGLAAARRQYAAALRQAGRLNAAAEQLAKAYGEWKAKGGQEAASVWAEWIDVLLTADSEAVTKAMADYEDDEGFATALDKLRTHLANRAAEGKQEVVARLATAALRDLPQRLTAEEAKALRERLAAAKAAVAAADAEQAKKLVGQLLAADASARNAASAALVSMGPRATPTVLSELRAAVRADQPNPELEKALLDVLKQIAPKLTGYDVTAGPDTRLAKIAEWMKREDR